jgi:hypothetical protein
MPGAGGHALRPPLLPRPRAPLDALRRPLPRVQGRRVRGPPPPALPPAERRRPRPQRPALSRPAHAAWTGAGGAPAPGLWLAVGHPFILHLIHILSQAQATRPRAASHQAFAVLESSGHEVPSPVPSYVPFRFWSLYHARRLCPFLASCAYDQSIRRQTTDHGRPIRSTPTPPFLTPQFLRLRPAVPARRLRPAHLRACLVLVRSARPPACLLSTQLRPGLSTPFLPPYGPRSKV